MAILKVLKLAQFFLSPQGLPLHAEDALLSLGPLEGSCKLIFVKRKTKYSKERKEREKPRVGRMAAGNAGKAETVQEEVG